MTSLKELVGQRKPGTTCASEQTLLPVLKQNGNSFLRTAQARISLCGFEGSFVSRQTTQNGIFSQLVSAIRLNVCIVCEMKVFISMCGPIKAFSCYRYTLQFPPFLQADNGCPDQIVRLRRLILAFASGGRHKNLFFMFLYLKDVIIL